MSITHHCRMCSQHI